MQYKDLEDVDISLDDLLNRKLVVLNDNHNSFDWVIYCFVTVLGYSHEQAHQCALIIHTKGKYAVKEGKYEELVEYKDRLKELGLGVVIQ